jgi:hypothetical protein
MKKVARNINVIINELQIALKREAADIIAIGNLLLEAKDQVEHGRWLLWLKANCGLSESTAQNYMNASRFAIKYPTVGVLKLRPTVLYALGSDLDGISVDKIEAIFKVAETEWVNLDRANAIIEAMPEERSGIEDEEEQQRPAAEERAREEAVQSEIDDILEGPPPELPPAPEATAPDIALPPFDQAVETLSRLQTKPLASFITTTHSLDKIRMVADFLRDVADKVPKEPMSDDERINRLRVLWKSGRDKYQSFFRVLHEVRREIGDDNMAKWCFTNLDLGLSVIERVSGVLLKVDRDIVKAELRKYKTAGGSAAR